MSYRDDASAWASRIAVLERELLARDEDLAERGEQLGDVQRQARELAAQLAEARQQLLEQERQILQLRRQLDRARGRADVDQPARPPGAHLEPAQAQAEADRCLAEGIRLHRAGESKQATRQFQRGLALVPGHADLLRALRRYT
jgi:DNA repair exonuclease SbcCD ATPase subunit